jgi:hypothetical protein
LRKSAAMSRSGKVAMGSTLPISPDFKKRTIYVLQNRTILFVDNS